MLQKYNKIWIFSEILTQIISNSHTTDHFLDHFHHFHSVKYNLCTHTFHPNFQLFSTCVNQCLAVYFYIVYSMYTQSTQTTKNRQKYDSWHSCTPGENSYFARKLEYFTNLGSAKSPNFPNFPDFPEFPGFFRKFPENFGRKFPDFP